ncbi:hypothetical protein B0T11DRAFT_355944 [Plectosphaerella cucumerina]|uniref:Nuclear GTPase SLIP-GC n=1 Tax=Plectosphaerella cucumerina TaxID=40658 RepID=A0A8K0X222_9PEZI|nr:hypothetical protein B0T11DRAFT_355944 [Plectosphaerella cucumerina]
MNSQDSPLDLGAIATLLPPAQLQLPRADGAYDIASEKPLSHALFDPAMSNALDIADDALVKLRQVLRKVRQKCPDAEGLRELEENCMKQLPAVGRRLAVVGDSGQGKSSLINSLLHVPGIAHTGDTGTACTSVVIEYHQKRDEQKSPFEITVEYSTGIALEEIVTNMVWSCRLYWLQGAKDASQTGHGEESDQDDCKKESLVAQEGLMSAFGHLAGFSVEFLLDMSDGAGDRVTEQCIKWAHAIEWPAGGWTTTENGSTVWHSAVNTVEECAAKTGAFMKDKFWPFTKVIKVYLDSPVLRTGLILADLPGLHDTNLARVKASKLYLLDCEEILIVAKIGRVVTDQSVKAYLTNEAIRLKTLRDQKPGEDELKLTVVCTASDDINEKAAIAEFVGDGKEISDAEMNQLTAELNSAKGSGNSKWKKAAKHRRKYRLISARANRITKALKAKYEPETGARLKVFCVGNHAYEKLCELGETDRVQATGIPALRLYCHTITADARLAEARYWMKTTVPGFLQSAEAWAHRMLSKVNVGEEQRVIITMRLAEIRRKVPPHVAKLLKMALEAYWVKFMESWTAKQDKWARKSVAESVSWEEWHWVSYSAWCRRNGNHNTRVRGPVNWNDLMICQMQKDLKGPWKDVFFKLKQLQPEVIDDFISSLKGFMDGTLCDVPTTERNMLFGTIQNMIEMWQHRIASEFEKLTKDVKNLKSQVLTADELGYVTREMVPTYRKAVNDRGTGIGARQRACIAEKLNSGTLFPSMATLFLADTENRVKESTESIEMVVAEVLDRLVHEFDVVLTPKKPDPSVESAVKELQKTVQELSKCVADLQSF